ncbi:MAG: YfiR family protein [Betaproteobacteria bacterium]|nr:YfiR family protein [Betaproteobacteria bacterium]
MSARRRLFRRILAAGLAPLCPSPTGFAQQQVLSDQQLLGAYLLNFLRYVDWPERLLPTPDSPLVLGILGSDAAGAFTGISGKLVKGHPVSVRPVLGAEDARSCHALYVPDQDSRRFVSVLRALHASPVLTISDAEGFIEVGGMIGLVRTDNRLQFEINLAVLSQAQLKASSQLLRLARSVVDGRPR